MTIHNNDIPTLNAKSIDPDEVAYYERLAQTWWDASGPFWPLHRLNKLRVAYLREFLAEFFQRDANLPQPLAGISVLDVGCGGGILSEAMARLGAKVTGIDVVERNIAVARRHSQYADLEIEYRLISAEALLAEGASYDVVLNMEVVEHVADLPGFMQACCDLVAPDGVMAIATINRTWLSWLFAIVGAEYILRWLPKGTHQWRRFPKPEELGQLLRKQEMNVIAQTGVRVNPFTRGFNLTSFMAVNYMLIASRDQQSWIS
jgi:2-polyprenyl-6-hydroxyphenyl methylase/3-demethylubiquinone-9 3-methyltransferase